MTEDEVKSTNQMKSIARRVCEYLSLNIVKREGSFQFSCIVRLRDENPDSPVSSVYFDSPSTGSSRPPPGFHRTPFGAAFDAPEASWIFHKSWEMNEHFFPQSLRFTAHTFVQCQGPLPQFETVRPIPVPEKDAGPLAGKMCQIRITRVDFRQLRPLSTEERVQLTKDIAFARLKGRPQPPTPTVPWITLDRHGRKEHFNYLAVIEGRPVSAFDMILRGASS